MPRKKHITAFPSAARAVAQTYESSAIATDEAESAHVIINVSSITASPSVTPKIQGHDPTSDSWYDLLVGPAITATGLTVLKVGRVSPSANAAAQDLLPATIRVTMTHADTDSITYSVGVNLG